jgi:DNA-directed RNA polymerase subunit M/transcription elongation factor TFIIS
VTKEQQNGCRKCGSEMIPSKAIVCRATGMSDFIGSKDVVTMSPDPRKPVLIDCLKCSKCGYSISTYQCHKDYPPCTFDEKFANIDS